MSVYQLKSNEQTEVSILWEKERHFKKISNLKFPRRNDNLILLLEQNQIKQIKIDKLVTLGMEDGCLI